MVTFFIYSSISFNKVNHGKPISKQEIHCRKACMTRVYEKYLCENVENAITCDEKRTIINTTKTFVFNLSKRSDTSNLMLMEYLLKRNSYIRIVHKVSALSVDITNAYPDYLEYCNNKHPHYVIF